MKPQPQLLVRERLSKSSIQVEIASVATAVPEHVTGQQEIADRAQTIFPQYARLDGLYTNTGIERRYSVEPKDWYLQPHTWEERNHSNVTGSTFWSE
jgi:alkylresorcinol/alkylpyrone synthase